MLLVQSETTLQVGNYHHKGKEEGSSRGKKQQFSMFCQRRTAGLVGVSNHFKGFAAATTEVVATEVVTIPALATPPPPPEPPGLHIEKFHCSSTIPSPRRTSDPWINAGRCSKVLLLSETHLPTTWKIRPG